MRKNIYFVSLQPGTSLVNVGLVLSLLLLRNVVLNAQGKRYKTCFRCCHAYIVECRISFRERYLGRRYLFIKRCVCIVLYSIYLKNALFSLLFCENPVHLTNVSGSRPYGLNWGRWKSSNPITSNRNNYLLIALLNPFLTYLCALRLLVVEGHNGLCYKQITSHG